MLVLVDFLMRNVSYVSEIAPGMVILVGSSQMEDEFLLTVITGLPMEEEYGLVDGYYPLERILEDGEGVILGEHFVVNRNGVILYENTDNISDTGEVILSVSQFIKRLRKEVKEPMPDVSELAMTPADRFYSLGKKTILAGMAFFVVFLLLYGFLNVMKAGVEREVDRVLQETQRLKEEKGRLKDRYWVKIGGVDVGKVKRLASTASFIDFIPGTVRVDISGSQIKIEGGIYAYQLGYVAQGCREKGLKCSFEYKPLRRGEDVYVVSVSGR